MTDLHISSHAISRYIERCDPLADYDTAVAALSSPVIQQAADFGAQFVRLGTGHRVVIEQHTVVTVMPADNYRRQVCRQGLPRFNRQCRKQQEQE